MALKQLFTNNAVSLLQAPIDSTSTLLHVLPEHGELFPTPQANEFFTITLEDQGALVQEIVHVTERIGDAFVVIRGQEGTEARAWSASQGNDTLVDHRLTALTLNRLSNSFANQGFPALTDYQEAIDYLLQGSPTSGGQAIDVEINTEVLGNETRIYCPSAFKPGTTSMYVGGIRLKRNVDFYEAGISELRLQFVLSPQQIEDGQNIVVDYIVA